MTTDPPPEPRQPVRLGPRGTLHIMIDRASRGAAYRWLGRVLVGAIGVAVYKLAVYLGGF